MLNWSSRMCCLTNGPSIKREQQVISSLYAVFHKIKIIEIVQGIL